MFINFTNHSSDMWEKNQINSAEEYGEIIDIEYPHVDPECSSEDIKDLAKCYVDKIISYKPKAVLVQGEMTLCYNVVKLLKEHNVLTLCACSKRQSVETIDESGRTIKHSVFQFLGFREY